jgi:hypothetical protein
LRERKYACFLLVLPLLAIVAACSKDSPSSPSQNIAPTLTAPALESPGDDEQLDTLRPTLKVKNGTSSQTTGARTYEFQLATSSSLSPVAVTRSGVAESTGGSTSIAIDQDLQSTTRYYWRVRMTQGTTTSEWSPTGRFRTKAVGYNNPGELYDPLVSGETVGTAFGSTTFVTGKGITLNAATSYVRYALPLTVATGEFSMEIEGLHPGGPVGKPRVFSMSDGIGLLTLSRYQMNAQYRGLSGNPDNCIAFKAVWGRDDVRLEPELHERLQSVVLLDPSRTYLWQATWDALTFRLVVRDGGLNGSVIYDRSKTAPAGTGPYAPVPHYAYLGANEAAFGGEDGTFPGIMIRNVWLSDKPRPNSLGSALIPVP